VAQEIATFYIEIIRGVPMLVILYYIAFVGAPGLTEGVNAVGRALSSVVPGVGQALVGFQVRNFDFTTRAIVALTVGYSAFIAEIFRAGISPLAQGRWRPRARWG
jgi:polar amino acid transport system permease protein